MSRDQPVISVIIPVFNDSIRLKSCLLALESQTYSRSAYEVIVIDNNSAENTAEVVKEFAQARLVYEAKPGSYAARNRGIAVAQGEILAFTDSDCIPNSDWLEKGAEQLMSHPNCGLLAGKIDLFFENPTAPTSVELYDSLNFLQQQFYVEQKHFGATANLFTFRQVINNVGPFNAEFKSAGDHEWGRRVAKAGYSQIYAENACIQHPARKTLKQLERKVIRVTDGYEDLRRHKLADGQKLPQDHWPAFLHSIASDLKEPFALTPKILGDSRLTGFIKKLSVTGVMFFAKYVRVIERVRLRLGKLERERL